MSTAKELALDRMLGAFPLGLTFNCGQTRILAFGKLLCSVRNLKTIKFHVGLSIPTGTVD